MSKPQLVQVNHLAPLTTIFTSNHHWSLFWSRSTATASYPIFLKSGVPLSHRRGILIPKENAERNKIGGSRNYTKYYGRRNNNKQQHNKCLFFPRIKFETVKGKFLSPRGIAKFPVTSAFSMTFNKSKRRSLDHSGIYLFEPVHGYGQLFTELTKGRQ